MAGVVSFMAVSIPTTAPPGKPRRPMLFLAPTRRTAHGFRADRIAGADPQGSGGAGPHLLARLLARQGRSSRVPERLREGVRGQWLARHYGARGGRRGRARGRRGRGPAPRGWG